MVRGMFLNISLQGFKIWFHSITLQKDLCDVTLGIAKLQLSEIPKIMRAVVDIYHDTHFYSLYQTILNLNSINVIKRILKNGSNNNLIISKIPFQDFNHQLDIGLIDLFSAGRVQNDR